MDPRESASTAKRAPKGRAAPRRPRGALFFLLLFLALVLALDAVVGDRGVVALVRARREYAELERALASARAQNTRLRAEADRLRTDPTAIEELARRNLGLIKPGETLFILKDVREPQQAPR